MDSGAMALNLSPWLAPRAGGRAALAVGTMNFGGRTSPAEAGRIVACALERGLPFFDTASSYGDGEAERVLGQALRGRREAVGIATKAGLARVRGKPEGLSPEALTSAVDASLQRLGTDFVDLLYLHQPDPHTPLEQTLDALGRLLQAGKVRGWGVSNHAAWQLLELQGLAKSAGLPPPAASQVLYNLLVRQLDVEYLPFTRRHPVHTAVYNPLAGGLLSGRYAPGAAIAQGSRFAGNRFYQRRYWSERLLAQAARLAALAQTEGLGLLELAYAWLAQREGVDSILAGPGSVAHLEAALAALQRPLSPALLARVDDAHRDFLGTDASYAR
jgi:aryl-alcohol dehydrogenase-like predicted oxidoreductase